MDLQRTIDTKHGRFILRPYRPEDESQILALWKTVFHKEMPVDLWRWKYITNPYGHHILLCVSPENRIVVMYAAVPFDAVVNGREIRMGQVMDIMAHPDYRGWLFIKTAKAFFEIYGGPPNMDVMAGFPGEKHYIIGQKLLKYRPLESRVTYLAARLKEISFGKCRLNSRIKKVEIINNAFTQLWERCADNYPVSIIRDEGFLQWRFVAHPFHRYQIWGYYSIFPNELKGYAILFEEPGYIRIVDILVSSDERAAMDFISRLCLELRDKGVQRIVTWLPQSHFLARALEACGFVSEPEPLGIIPVTRSFNPSITFDIVSKNLYYTMADGDLF